MRSPPSSPGPAGPAGAGWQVHTALLAVQVVFAGYHVVAKVLLEDLSPLALVGLRVSLATPLLMAMAWAVDRTLPRWRDLPILALLGFLGVFANQVLFIIGLGYTTATNAAILMPSIPVFAVAVAAVLRIEKIGRRRLAGIALAALGALVMVNPLSFSLAGGALLGNGLILANCLFFAAFLVLQRPVLRRLPWRTVIAGAFFFGTLGVVAVAWRDLAAIEVGALPANVWWGVTYIVLLPTLFSYSLNTWAIRRSSPSLTAAYTTLQPVAAAGLAAVFLGERPGWLEAAGFTLIVGGLWVVSRRRAVRS